MTLLGSIVDGVTRLNGLYGYGTVLGVTMSSDWKTGWVTIQRTSCKPEERKLRYDLATCTIHFAGHQRSLK